MIPRYTRPEMGKIFSDQNRFDAWLAVEIAAAEALAETGEVPTEAVPSPIRLQSIFGELYTQALVHPRLPRPSYSSIQQRPSMRLTLFTLALIAVGMPFAQGQAGYRIDNFAGTSAIGDGGPAAQALLSGPRGIAVDTRGGYYITDALQFRVRYVDSAGNISTVVDRDSAALSEATTHYQIGNIGAIAVDAQNRVYFTDDVTCVVVRRESSGSLSVVAGIVDNCGFGGDGGQATLAKLNIPTGLTFTASGALLIGDTWNHRIRKVDLTTGVITTFAGNGAGTFGANGGLAVNTPLSYPGALVDFDGSILVVEGGFQRIRVIYPNLTISNVAGTGALGNTGDGGLAPAATFRSLSGLAIDRTRLILYVGDSSANRVRAIALVVTNPINAFAGLNINGTPFANSFSGDGGQATQAGLGEPQGLAVDAAGNVLIADSRNNRIRSVQAGGVIRTVAGRWPVVTDGTPAVSAELDHHTFGSVGDSLALDFTGGLYIADRRMLTVRRVDSNGTISTYAGLPINLTPANNAYGFSSGDGASAKLAKFGAVDAIASDTAGNLYVADGASLRRVSSSGTITKLATLPGVVYGMRVDSANRFLYFTLGDTHTVYKVDLTASTPAPTLVAGAVGTSGFSGDGGPATAALLSFPAAVALDAQGNVLVGDFSNFRLRRIAADGRISTVAGTGTNRPSGTALLTPGAALSTAIGPAGIAVDPNGNIILAEFRPVIRILDSVTGIIRPIAGTAVAGSSGDGGPARAATLQTVDSVVVDPAGVIYIRDGSARVRVLRPIVASALQLNGGDSQSGLISTTLATPLSVRVVSGAASVPGATVDFKVTSGAATLSALSAVSDANGVASTTVTLGATAGPIVVTASAGSLTPVTFRLTATATSGNPNRPLLSGSIATAGAYGAGTVLAPGTWIEIYGTKLSATTREWGGADFTGDRAPTSLDGVSVSIGGKPAFVWYISPTQLNVQAPDGIATGDALVVTTAQGVSDPYVITAAARTPSMLAPPSFKVNGVQYVAALFSDRAFAGRENLIAGVAFRPAKPGDTLVIYGVGLGATEPASPAGKVVAGTANLPNVVVQIGGVSANVTFAGLVASSVGLYQVNVVVPNIPAGDVPLTVRVAGTAGAQNLTLTIGAP
ncbi:MAG: IPT/TIG domain-containing protein [Bryobacteraceae bacterium]